MSKREMKACRLCHTTTTGHKNDMFDGMIRDVETLAGYIIDKRFNQAGNVLINSATNLMQTFNGCCASSESIKKYGDKTIKLIRLGQEIHAMNDNGEFNK